MQSSQGCAGSEEEFSRSRRATFSRQSKINHGTLNLFSPTYYQPEQQQQQQPTRLTDAPRATRTHSGHRYHNYESSATREFPSSGLRRVEPVRHTEAPQGIRHLGNVSAAKQNVQVVNIKPSYKDPACMTAPRACVHVLPEKQCSQNVKDSLAYAAVQGEAQQLRGDVLNKPVGVSTAPGPRRVMDYTAQENFCQAVRDHVQKRAGGVTEFYVLLCRDGVGGVTRTTPSPQVREWALERAPESHRLTLARCRDQLVSLTGISVSLLTLAELMWDMTDYVESSARGDENRDVALPQDEELLQHQEIGQLGVPFKDFAAAFGSNSTNVRLAVKKV